MNREALDFANEHSLEKTNDPEIDKPVFRRPGFNGISTFEEIDQRLAKYLREARDKAGLKQADFAPLMGLSTPVYGRYERAFSKLHVTRMVHISEVLNVMPIDMLYEAAPHLWGKSEEEAKDRVELAKLVANLPHSTTRDLLSLVKKMADLQSQVDAKPQSTDPVK
ncbi:helix-turn-helix domain-containing protein [Brucella anthropi]|uniref:helix-turn-helix domain-containing protein n=1 Tax=Brucella anthropi TaxID=529 RepID=UPI0024494A51|nr:helix-turn-helix transcriptional regulator [Brucella anthropi]MDH0369811.1 helix-turn-helix transcriptional regulator [Brucella anthropi]